MGCRKELTEAGLDGLAETVGWHLTHHHGRTVSRATIHRILIRAGTVTPDPPSAPRAATSGSKPTNRTRPGEPTSPTTACRTAPSTSPTAAGSAAPTQGTDVEILTWLDDCSRYALSVTAHRPVTDPILLTTFC